MPGTPFLLEVNPQLPLRLKRLHELANNLWYSWDRPTRTLFARLHPTLWRRCGHSPKAFLKRVSQWRLNEAAEDRVFLNAYNRVLSAYDTYHAQPSRVRETSDFGEGDLVAYFCAEFGFHESLPIYSGGLGILAGDHCKTASDLGLPFVGIGLLYRQGYFFQTIDNEGNQHAQYADSDFDDLPISPLVRKDGAELKVTVPMPGRDVVLKVWQARVGHVRLYLLDTSLPENSAADRAIAHRLYGGDRTTRIEQEIILGVGGVRALAALGITPTVWHINEGHAAFLLLERIRMLIEKGLDFASAIEAAAANTVFTTHTAVPAGHDHFAEDVVRHYFEGWLPQLGITTDHLLSLGRSPDSPDFNMTALAIRGSRFHNGVSTIHGEVSSKICSKMWPQIDPEENPVGHVTNGVHVPTFLAPDWYDLFDRYLGYGWEQRLTDRECWQGIHAIPDQQFWAVRQALKSQLFHLLRNRLSEQHARNHGSEAHLDRVLRLANPTNPHALTIGFARRFATYKRAPLLFENIDWLREIVCDENRPVIFLFAGKAHPADIPGQDLIRRIAEVSRMSEFEGRILLIEGYDLRLARRLVSGVDVWLNNPIYPLEASGTSGMKAALNGVINLSILDGWWGEGYDGSNGWAVKPVADTTDPARRDREEVRTLYELLQDSVVPMFYDVGPLGFSPAWVAMAKRSIATLLPRFNTERMLTEYVENFYRPAARQWHRVAHDDFRPARDLAAWKTRIRNSWHNVRLRRIDHQQERISFGDSIRFELAVGLDGLKPEDVKVEVMVGRPSAEPRPLAAKQFELRCMRPLDNGEQLYAIEMQPELCGKIDYRFRVYPHHEMLTHPFEMGMMLWL
ncbi:MAG TPA: alpha-glucan family phosphorylase [Rhodocyclaceae bacterium]|nr:alpha-glucan family phosphorylase [Rhodocyclaceae bacterium]HMV54377.1 alpha-glucan family phosphorylase [Rhodocyclaceae bacterium]HMZ84442.1 alpha-glucan family phosphorylase [Rhodocyclaceae bacterium]HNA04793.1 alpha-glucan family phosphorylase [Rhodocyclaceae bacterium]HNB79056.1 alpha-glucan family phosphorylase [Rhodocyclaceae bacterium]